MFLEIIAPDPKADPEAIDPVLRDLFYDRLLTMKALTPMRWALGTSNLERTMMFMRRALNRPSEIRAGSRKRGWGREENWRWVAVTVPESRVTPIVVEWSDESKRPQDRAPQGCSVEIIHVNSRNYKPLLNLIATMQVDINLTGADMDSMAYELTCPKGQITMESGVLNRQWDESGKLIQE